MKNHFKRRKSSGSGGSSGHGKSMICSGNDDITFIRYSHEDQDSVLGLSLPYEEEGTPTTSMDELPRNVIASYSSSSLLGVVLVENDYDEVPREDIEEDGEDDYAFVQPIHSETPSFQNGKQLLESNLDSCFSTMESGILEDDSMVETSAEVNKNNPVQSSLVTPGQHRLNSDDRLNNNSMMTAITTKTDNQLNGELPRKLISSYLDHRGIVTRQRC